MNQTEFKKVVEERFLSCADLLTAKGADYSQDGDRLSNFKEVAALLDLEPEQVWGVYFMKHVVAILKHAGGKDLKSEAIEGRIDDAINYLVLYAGLVQERKDGRLESPEPYDP